jgi:hypothetical protein
LAFPGLFTKPSKIDLGTYCAKKNQRNQFENTFVTIAIDSGAATFGVLDLWSLDCICKCGKVYGKNVEISDFRLAYSISCKGRWQFKVRGCNLEGIFLMVI